MIPGPHQQAISSAKRGPGEGQLQVYPGDRAVQAALNLHWVLQPLGLPQAEPAGEESQRRRYASNLRAAGRIWQITGRLRVSKGETLALAEVAVETQQPAGVIV